MTSRDARSSRTSGSGRNHRRPVVVRSLLGRAVTMVASVLLVTLAFPMTAEAAHVQCGEVITRSGTTVTLDSDVGPCPTDGIIIRANNVTLNLNGFDVFGDADPTTDNVGVRIEGNQNSVVDCAEPFSSVPPCAPGRQDSEIREFNAGVAILGGASNEVCRLTVRRNIGSPFGDFGDGIVVQNSNANTIANATVDLNGPFGGITLLGDADANKVGRPIRTDSDGASLRTSCDGGNTVSNNNIPFGPINQDIGIRVEADAVEYPNSNDIQNNLVTGSGLDGVALFFRSPGYEGSSSNKVVSNTIEGNGFGVSVARRGDGIRLNGAARDREAGANNVLVEDNIVRNNAASGIAVNSQHTKVKHNVVSGNGFGNPPRFEPGDGIRIANDRNVVTQDNTVTGNAGDGISLRNAATGNQITQNSVTGHVTGNGIRALVGSLDNHIVNNTATGNGVVPAGYDLRDDNPNPDPAPPCETNLWQSNDELTKNQPCIN